MSRDIDIDEILKKASSRKGRNFFNFYRLKNNDYGFGFFGLHGRLTEPVGEYKGAGLCHNLIPEAFFQSDPWAYYWKFQCGDAAITWAKLLLGKGSYDWNG